MQLYHGDYLTVLWYNHGENIVWKEKDSFTSYTIVESL